ncbi:hypothetical protein AX16_008728 [Volvariella volvacea WC 439]|nr:hypothetical protein AX16_008728 [Volvariella volvacea WC 439]
MSAERTVTPSEQDLRASIVQLKAEHPSLGISKIHSLLLSTQPSWMVSEKRTRKILQSEGLIIASNDTNVSEKELEELGLKDTPEVYPTSKLIPKLDLSRWTDRVEVKFLNKVKGKGLVAKEAIKEGEIVWKEDPWILAAEWEIYDLQQRSLACTYCSTPVSPDSPLNVTCTSSASNSSNLPYGSCPARFCNRLCQSRSQKIHPLLCPAQNPASVPLLRWARATQWMGLNALAQSTARILLSYQNESAAVFEEDYSIYMCLATLGMEERLKYSFKGAEPDKEGWKKAHQLFVQAFHEPTSVSEKKRLARILKKPTPENIVQDILSYDPGFLQGLGRMSLNLEAHGGLYTLHSHLNHSCIPNLRVRHLDQRTALSRITVTAFKDIQPGEELVITYVNPEFDVKQRQGELEGWGFGSCKCKRCIEEWKDWKEEQKVNGEQEGDGMEDLAKELKASLGVA